jgi:translation initiation factor IF-1
VTFSIDSRVGVAYVLVAQSQKVVTEVRVARSDLVQMEGVVKEVMVGGNFRVEVEGGHNVLAQLAGNMRRNRIRVVLGDQVTVAVSPYDPTRGLIVFRAK